MVTKIYSILFLMFLSGVSYAYGDKYKVCFVNGFFLAPMIIF